MCSASPGLIIYRIYSVHKDVTQLGTSSPTPLHTLKMALLESGTLYTLAVIILFLQWRPSGLFVTKSRSLES